MLDLRQFAVLHAVRDGGSLSRAAADLRLSVPTVTHHLDALERHLGARLVNRGPRGASLTALGTMFADDVDDVLGRLELATRKVDDARESGAVTLRIGTFSSAGSRLLPEALHRLIAATKVWAGAAERQLARLAAAAGFHPRTLTRTDDYAMVHGLVASGLGLALIPSSSIDPRFAVAAVHVQQSLGARRVAYVMPADRPTPAALRLGAILRGIPS